MMFQMLDANHDGVVTRPRPSRRSRSSGSRGGDNGGAAAGRMQRMIDRLFGDAQSLTLQQFEAQALARFDAQDLNHDGDRHRGRASAGAGSAAGGSGGQRPAPAPAPRPSSAQ